MTREEAIKILKAIRVYDCYPKSASEETKEAIDMAIEALSAEAAQEWIPVSERLPNDDGDYLVCMTWDSHKMDVLMWADGWNCLRLINGEIDRENEIDGADLIAWRELPEPYKENRKEYEVATEQIEHDALYEPTYNLEDGSM